MENPVWIHNGLCSICNNVKEKLVVVHHVKRNNKYVLLTKHEVKMAGYWPSSFFVCVYGSRGLYKVHKLTEKERGQYPAILTKKAWSIKNLLFGFWENFSCGRWQRVVKGIFVTRDRPFFFLVKREMANFSLVNRDFHSSREA